jgi:nitrate/TMAO reductase-like tetraheme cytochrome c subunit
MKIEFKDVPVGASFISNGNFCTKVSTRTAVLVQYMRTFHFKSNEIVEVA